MQDQRTSELDSAVVMEAPSEVRRMVPRSWRDGRAAQAAFAWARAALGLALGFGLVSQRSALADEGREAPPPVSEQPVQRAIEVLTLNPCLERAPLVEEIEGWLERSSVDARLRVKIGEENGTLRFSIAVGEGERMMHEFPDLPPDCEGQRRAVALSVALAIDAIVPESGAPGGPAPSVALSAYGALTTALPDRAAWGGGVTARVRVSPSFWPGLGALVAVAPGQALVAELPLRYDTWLMAARLEGCFVFPPVASPASLAACAGPWVGAVTTRSRGVPDPRSESELWGALAAALELHIRVTPEFGFHAGADVLVPLRRSKVRLEGSEGHRAIEQDLPGVTGMVRLGPEVFF